MSNALPLVVQYEDGTIVVEDTRKPVWFGDYYKGKLAIFSATLEGNDDPELMGTFTLLAVMTAEDDNNFVIAAHYPLGADLKDVIDNLQSKVIIEYTKTKAKQQPPSLYAPGTDTRH